MHRHKIGKIFFTLMLVLSSLFPALLSFAETMPVDTQVSLSSEEAATKKIKETTEKITVDVDYTPQSLEKENPTLENETETEDLLQISLPAGLTYQAEDNPEYETSVQLQDEDLVLNLNEAQTFSLVLSVDYENLAAKTEVSGVHHVNATIVGETEALTLKKVETKKDSSSEAETPSNIETIGAVALTETEAETEVPVTPRTQSPIEARDIGTQATLEIGTTTNRTLPVADLDATSAANYSNVLYYDVGTRAEWGNVFRNATFAAGNSGKIVYVNLTNNISLTDVTSPTSQSAQLLTAAGSNIKVVVNGNGIYTLDSREKYYYMYTNSIELIYQNIKLQNSSGWGMFNGYDGNVIGSTVTYHNVSQYGHQAFEGSKSRVILSGDCSFVQTPTNYYQSDVNGQTVRLFNNGVGQSNIGAREIYIKAGSNITAKNALLGANFAVFNRGCFFMEEGAPSTVNMDNTTFNSASGSIWNKINDYSVASISTLAQNVGGGSGDVWSTNERPAELKSLSGDIYLASNAQVTIKNGKQRAAFAGAVQINSGSSLLLKDGASLDIAIEEDSSGDTTITTYEYLGNSQVPIFFNGNGTIDLANSASLKVESGRSFSDGSLNDCYGPVIRSRTGRLTINVNENANFDVKTTSVENSGQGVIYAPASGSAINISKNSSFDLGCIKQNSNGNNNSLINLASTGKLNIPATGDYAHQIRQWNFGNLTDTEDVDYQPLDNTVVTYSGSNLSNKTTAIAKGFGDNGAATNFKNDFSTKAQRITVTPVKFKIAIDAPITNATSSDGTYTVTGTAEPYDGTVLLSGGPFGNDASTEDSRKAKIQADNTWIWTGSLSRPFHWQEKIRATYYGQDDIFIETEVTDVTPPTGTGATLYIEEGQTIPEAKTFIDSVLDINPTNTNLDDFSYEFSAGNINTGTGAITNGEPTQEYNGTVIIKDASLNASNPVDIKMVVYAAGYYDQIFANELTVYEEDVASYTPNTTNYRKYLISSMDAHVYKVENNKLVDLTNEIFIDNFTDLGIKASTKAVRFKINASSSNGLATDLEKIVIYRIKADLVDPRDPSSDRPANSGSENDGTGETGELRIDYVPTAIDFGNQTIRWQDQVLYAKSTTEGADQWIQITDRSSATDGWSLKANFNGFSATDNSGTLTGASIVLPQGELYNSATTNLANPTGLSSKGSVMLSTTATTIFTGNGDNSKNKSTYVWKKDQVQLALPKGQGHKDKTYETTINWNLVKGVQN